MAGTELARFVSGAAVRPEPRVAFFPSSMSRQLAVPRPGPDVRLPTLPCRHRTPMKDLEASWIPRSGRRLTRRRRPRFADASLADPHQSRSMLLYPRNVAVHPTLEEFSGPIVGDVSVRIEEVVRDVDEHLRLSEGGNV